MILNTWLTYLMLVSGAAAIILAIYMVIDTWRSQRK